MKLHEPWTIFQRRVPSGKLVWYFRAWDESRRDHRTTARSTGETSKARARAYCRRLEAEGRLLQPDAPVVVPGAITFGTWAKDFWSWDGEYVQTRLKFGDPRKPPLSPRYVEDAGRILDQRILPAFKHRRMVDLTPQEIESWALHLRDKGLSGKRVNNCIIVLRTMLKEARRAGLLSFDVGQKGIIRVLGTAAARRGRLTLEEVRTLFSEENAGPDGAWRGRSLYRALSLVAAATGCRQGELLALHDRDIHPTHLEIRRSWNWKFGLGPTKSKRERVVPLPTKAHEALQPFLGSGGFVFSMDGGRRPVSGSRATGALYEALEFIGISPGERKARGIVFHGWRRWLNTSLRADGVPDDLVRRVVGHESEVMTDVYTSYVTEDFAPVLAVQNRVFG